MSTKHQDSNIVSCRVDRETDEFVDREADRVAAGSRSEYIRRLLTVAQENKNGNLRCPECSSVIIIDFREL